MAPEVKIGSMAEQATPLPLTASRADQIFPRLTSAQIERVATHGRTRSSQRRGFGRTRGQGHSILCRHFRRIGGCAADVRNRNAYFDFQRWSVHGRDQYAFGPSCDGAYSCATRWRSHPARSRKPPRPGANRRGAERDPDACVHSSAGGIASARHWRCNTPRLQSFGRYPSHQGILHAQWPPIYVHRSGTRRRRSEPPGSLPCLCR